jgi:hypothetical protein
VCINARRACEELKIVKWKITSANGKNEPLTAQSRSSVPFWVERRGSSTSRLDPELETSAAIHEEHCEDHEVEIKSNKLTKKRTFLSAGSA